nr:hypothetical protein [Tanacetum cinerariifolium]
MKPSDTLVCYFYTCEQCGNILSYGTCLNCYSGTRNSFTYDPIPESFDEVQISPNLPPQYHFNIYLCQICESNSHYGYECSQRVPLVNELEPRYIQNFNDNDYSHGFPDCGVTHEPYQCQPKNHEYYHEQNSCYDSNSFGFDHCQPPQYTINHPIFNAHNAFLDSQNELTIAQNKIMEQMTQLTSMCEMTCQIIQKKQEEKRIEEEQAAKVQNSKIPVCYDDDDDYDSAITSNEPVDSLSMGDGHLNTIPAIESDELINPVLRTLLSGGNISNPLFEEEIIPMKINQLHFNVESDLIESMLNHDSSIIPSSFKIDSLLDEFASEFTLLKLIPPRIDKTDYHPENEIRLTERLLYDNSSPRPPEEFVSKNSDADIESFSPSPIPNEDSDTHMEEIGLTFILDDPMPPSIEDDDDDSERDIQIHEELLDNYSLSLPVNESFYFDIPSFSRPPTKPPDGNTGILNIKMMGDVLIK